MLPQPSLPRELSHRPLPGRPQHPHPPESQLMLSAMPPLPPQPQQRRRQSWTKGSARVLLAWLLKLARLHPLLRLLHSITNLPRKSSGLLRVQFRGFTARIRCFDAVDDAAETEGPGQAQQSSLTVGGLNYALHTHYLLYVVPPCFSILFLYTEIVCPQLSCFLCAIPNIP